MMRQAFAASLASSSICGYVAGVGDRHLDNILLDFSTGELIHIDFGYVLGTAYSSVAIPELVPFRATSALLDVLKPLNAQSWLEIDMARTMRALQDGSTLLKGVMDIFYAIRSSIENATLSTQVEKPVPRNTSRIG